jgi:hypothetical protein
MRLLPLAAATALAFSATAGLPTLSAPAATTSAPVSGITWSERITETLPGPFIGWSAS